MGNYDHRRRAIAIDAAVQRFHERVTADPDLAGQFDGMDMRRIMAHQITLLGLFFGEPARHKPART
jgi:hemoglobin